MAEKESPGTVAEVVKLVMEVVKNTGPNFTFDGLKASLMPEGAKVDDITGGAPLSVEKTPTWTIRGMFLLGDPKTVSFKVNVNAIVHAKYKGKGQYIQSLSILGSDPVVPGCDLSGNAEITNSFETTEGGERVAKIEALVRVQLKCPIGGIQGGSYKVKVDGSGALEVDGDVKFNG